MSKLKIGSLFTGVGGLENELIENSKYCLSFVADPDEHCSAILKHNHPDVPNIGSVENLDTKNIPDADVLMGGVSCQGFSSQGRRYGLKHNKSRLFYEFADIIEAKQPKYVVFENVTGATTHKDFEIVKQIFGDIGYEIDYDIFNAREYSPTIQQRRRIILLATNKKFDQVRLNRTVPDIKLDEEMQDIERRLVGISKSHREKHIDIRLNHGIANTLVTGYACAGMSTRNYINENGVLRDLTINEAEALMTWPKDLTKYGIVNGDRIEIPLKQRYKICGNGVVSKMIPNLLRDLK